VIGYSADNNTEDDNTTDPGTVVIAFVVSVTILVFTFCIIGFVVVYLFRKEIGSCIVSEPVEVNVEMNDNVSSAIEGMEVSSVGVQPVLAIASATDEATKVRDFPSNPFYAPTFTRKRSMDVVRLPDFTTVFENTETSWHTTEPESGRPW